MMIAVLAVGLIISGTIVDADFEVKPTSQNVAIGQTAVFQCKHGDGLHIIWKVDDQVPRNSRVFSFSSSRGLHTMTITSSPSCNCSRITCCVQHRVDPTSEVCTEDAVLMIQGPLNPVSNLVRENSTLIWSAPPSLDLSGIEIDIIYCVEVYNITCAARKLVIRDCNVTRTTYATDVLASDNLLEIIVTPRSNVESARIGASQTLRDQLLVFTVNSTKVSVNLDGETRDCQVVLSFDENDERVPASFALLLDPLDGLGDIFEVQTITERNGNILTLNVVPGLPAKRLWNSTVLAYGCPDHSGVEISTHDIQNLSFTSPRPGEIRVTGDLVDGSTATGVLIIASDGSTSHYHVISNEGGRLQVEGSISCLSDGQYRVSAFAVEKNGLPFERAATRTRVVNVTNDGKLEQSFPIEYSLQSNSTGVCITCTFLDSSITKCVAVVHERISQLNSSGLMNIESSHKFTRSGDTASGCIEGVNLEDYQVGVFGVRELHPNVAGTKEGGAAVCSGCIAGAVLGIVFFIASAVIVAVIVAAIILVIHRRRIKLPLQAHTESGLLSPAGSTVNTPTICHQYEECPPPNLTNQQQEVIDVQGFSDSSDSSNLDNPPPLSPRLEEPLRPTDQTPLEPNTLSPSSPATTETDISSDSNAAGANDDDPDDPTYDQPVFTKTIKTSPTGIHPGLCADHSTTSGEADDGTCGPTYAQPQLTTSSTVQCPPAADNVVYNKIKGFQNQHYAMLSNMPTSVMTPDGHQKMEYAVIRQQPSKPTSDEGVNPDMEVDPNECSKKKISEEKITEDQAFHTLLCYSSQWQSLGEALSLDEDHLDEIFTNNETDEACLQEMLGLYFKRSDFKHSWEEIDAALKRIRDKSCITESDIHHQPQPSEEPLRQTETSGGGPVLRPLLINKNANGSTSIVPHCDKPPDQFTSSTLAADRDITVNGNPPSSVSVGEANQSDGEQNSQVLVKTGIGEHSDPTTTSNPEESPDNSKVEAGVVADMKLKQTVEGVNGEELHVVSNADLAPQAPFVQPKGPVLETKQESTSTSQEKVPEERPPVSMLQSCNNFNDPVASCMDLIGEQEGVARADGHPNGLQDGDTSGSQEEIFAISTSNEAVEDIGTEELTSPPIDGLLESSQRVDPDPTVKDFRKIVEQLPDVVLVFSKESGDSQNTKQLATPKEMRKSLSDSKEKQLPVAYIVSEKKAGGQEQTVVETRKPKSELVTNNKTFLTN